MFLFHLPFGRGAGVGFGLGLGLGLGALVRPGTGASVEPSPVIPPCVGTKLQTGLKQHGWAASLIRWHSVGRVLYFGHLETQTHHILWQTTGITNLVMFIQFIIAIL